MSEARSLDDDTVREIAWTLILSPHTIETDERYRRIKERAPADFIAIQGQVYQLLVVEDCALFGGIATLGSESYEWILENVEGLPFKTKKHILSYAINKQNRYLINLALECFNGIELSQHTTSIENLMHEVLNGDYDDQTKKKAEILRNKANEAMSISFGQKDGRDK